MRAPPPEHDTPNLVRDERPPPPEHDTPNTGRVRKYDALIEPSAPLANQRRERIVIAAAVVGGVGSALLIQAVLAVF